MARKEDSVRNLDSLGPKKKRCKHEEREETITHHGEKWVKVSCSLCGEVLSGERVDFPSRRKFE